MAAERPHQSLDQKPIVPVGFNVQEVLVAGNRGPCGGVEMSLAAFDQTMDIIPNDTTIWTTNMPINFPQAFEKYGSRLQIANKDLSNVPNKSILVISAHGAPPQTYQMAVDRELDVVDVTCPVVLNEQLGVRETTEEGLPIVFLGEINHPETIGIIGQVPEGMEIVVFDPNVPIPENAYIPQGARLFVKTTNDPEKNEARITELEARVKIDTNRRLPCYALKNRYAAGKAITDVDFWMVVGDISSNNARGLRDLALDKQIPSMLIAKPEDIDWNRFSPEIKKVGLTAAASAPEEFTQRVLDQFRLLSVNVVELAQVMKEASRTFRLPKEQIESLRQKYTH